MLETTLKVGPAVTQDVVSIVNVVPSTSFAEAGQTVGVSADVLNGVTQTEQAQASFTVLDGSGDMVFTSTAVPLTLAVLTNVATVNLGSLTPAASLPASTDRGEHRRQQRQAHRRGDRITGLVIEAPVTANLTVSSDAISPTDSITVTNPLTVGGQTILGSVATHGEAASAALDGSLPTSPPPRTSPSSTSATRPTRRS